MDYSKIYKENYQLFFKKYEGEFYKFLHDAIVDDKQFDYAFRLLVPLMFDIADSEKGFREIQNSRAREIVTSSKKMYKTDGLRKVLNNELKVNFETIQNETNNLFLDYVQFLKSYSCQHAYWDYVDKVKEEKDIITVLFNLNELDKYSFYKKIDYSKVIKEYDFEYDNLHPEERVKKAINSTKNSLLTKNENFLLWHVLISVIQESEKGFLIEMGRALALSNIEDSQLLTDKYKNNNGYKFLTTGIDVVYKQENKVKLIKDLLHKIKPFKLKKTEVKLKMILRNL